MTPVERLLAKLPDAKQARKGWSAHCPAHEDRRASLSIDEGEDGRALVMCHAGCKADAICAAVGLRVVDLMPTANTIPTPSKPRSNGKRCIVAQYDYRDETRQRAISSRTIRSEGFSATAAEARWRLGLERQRGARDSLSAAGTACRVGAARGDCRRGEGL